MITQRAFEAYERALMSEQPVIALRAVVQQRLSAGQSRDTLRGELEQLVYELRRQHREADEDAILDVTDFLTGWSSPHTKL